MRLWNLNCRLSLQPMMNRQRLNLSGKHAGQTSQAALQLIRMRASSLKVMRGLPTMKTSMRLRMLMMKILKAMSKKHSHQRALNGRLQKKRTSRRKTVTK